MLVVVVVEVVVVSGGSSNSSSSSTDFDSSSGGGGGSSIISSNNSFRNKLFIPSGRELRSDGSGDHFANLLHIVRVDSATDLRTRVQSNLHIVCLR